MEGAHTRQIILHFLPFYVSSAEDLLPRQIHTRSPHVTSGWCILHEMLIITRVAFMSHVTCAQMKTSTSHKPSEIKMSQCHMRILNSDEKKTTYVCTSRERISCLILKPLTKAIAPSAPMLLSRRNSSVMALLAFRVGSSHSDTRVRAVQESRRPFPPFAWRLMPCHVMAFHSMRRMGMARAKSSDVLSWTVVS